LSNAENEDGHCLPPPTRRIPHSLWQETRTREILVRFREELPYRVVEKLAGWDPGDHLHALGYRVGGGGRGRQNEPGQLELKLCGWDIHVFPTKEQVRMWLIARCR